MVISDIVVTDSAANLNPVVNTLVNSPTSGGGGADSSGGGAIGWLLLLGLGMFQKGRQLKI